MAKILVIDDDVQIRQLLGRILGRLGHEVVAAENGTDGLAIAGDPTVQLILTDLFMQGTPSDMELVRQLRAKRPQCPIVVVSGFPDGERLDECDALQINDFLTKPFEIGFIATVIKRLLGSQGQPV